MLWAKAIMARARKSHLKKLRPYLVDERPKENGEMDMHCPLHEDSKRSANINVEKGVWNCHKGCGGGTISELIKREEEWVDPPSGLGRSRSSNGQGSERVTNAKISGWVQALHADDDLLTFLNKERGLTDDTILEYEIGWDKFHKVYTIPIRGPQQEIMNVRRYDPNPSDDRRKIYSVKGMGKPQLYPVANLEGDSPIVLCEGEFDMMISNQNGYRAVTKTGSAKTWNGEWNKYFIGRDVFLCHDCDQAGKEANIKIGRMLRKVARHVYVIDLPYEHVEKHGKDLTDFFKEHNAQAFWELMEAKKNQNGVHVKPSDASVIESFDSKQVGAPMKILVTVKGKQEPGYSVPRLAKLTCTRDAGDKCLICPMNAAGGEDDIEIDAADPTVLEMLDATKQQTGEVLRKSYGALKCNLLQIEIEDFQAVETLFARPSVEHVSLNGSVDAASYKSMKVTNVGSHDTMPNNTFEVIGALQPNPKTQTNEFQAWEINSKETMLDTFELSEEAAESLKKFQPRRGQRPLKKMGEISRAMAEHVTHIHGRPEMHALMDIAWHSVVSFKFGGKLERKGWIDCLVIGDTRTGKSEAATRLCQYYGAGEVVSCEAASFAGIVGGLQQYGSGKEWSVSWGVVPINDRRLVVLDEVGGLKTEEIAQLSDVRSRGVAQLTKIQQEQTVARTRLVWLGNPRNKQMSDYTFGVQAISDLIGNSEDIARFDLAMCVKKGEVSPELINRGYGSKRHTKYDQESCRNLVRWAWSRQPDQIVWKKSAEETVYRLAKEMGRRYVEEPPLVQSANIRIKIARVAIALAARLFSCDRTRKKLVVKKEHVEDAVAFMDILYNMSSFGYADQSREKIKDRKYAISNKNRTKQFLKSYSGLAKFLRGAGHFRRQDLEEMLSITKEEANMIISELWDTRMVHKDKGNVVVEPTLHELLREVK